MEIPKALTFGGGGGGIFFLVFEIAVMMYYMFEVFLYIRFKYIRSYNIDMFPTLIRRGVGSPLFNIFVGRFR